jgi:serine/threonine-protein kinase HipA
LVWSLPCVVTSASTSWPKFKMLQLDVYLEDIGAPIGKLSRSEAGEVSFRYLTDDLPYPISQSLPVREESFGDVEARDFFDNLLFENELRDQTMQRYGIAQSDIVGLLYHLGQDCPGAISVVPEGSEPGKRLGDLAANYKTLSDDDLIGIMQSLRDHRRMPADSDDPSPLAGVQGKLALTVLPDGRYALPEKGSGAPTTHILKVPRPMDMRLVDHEHILMSIADDLLDHPVSETKIVGEGALRGLLITRYDRVIEAGKVRRVHQEDFCQALGIGPQLKYQRNGVPGRMFNAQRVGEVISVCAAPAQARAAFFEGTIVNLLLGNTDNHAKNHSLLYTADRPTLAPFYDIVPTLIDDQVTHQLSFDIGGAQMTDDITVADLKQFALDLGYRNYSAPMRKRLEHLTTKVVEIIPELGGPARKRLGDAFAEQASAISKALAMDLAVPERDMVQVNRP